MSNLVNRSCIFLSVKRKIIGRGPARLTKKGWEGGGDGAGGRRRLPPAGNGAPPARKGRPPAPSLPPGGASPLLGGRGGVRGGCGRHAPPQKGLLTAGGRDVAAWGKPRPAAGEGKPMQARHAKQCGSRQKRSVATTAVPTKGRAPLWREPDGAPGSTPGAGARQGQRGRRTRKASPYANAMMKPQAL